MPDDEERHPERGKPHSSGTGEPPARGRRRQDGEPPRRRNPDADPVKVHREYLDWHIGGGAPPTPELYAQAIEQFRRIPGAVRAPATETPAAGNQGQAEDEPSQGSEESEESEGSEGSEGSEQ
ncbi:MAG TPA: hypothetical protein VMA73_20820 [Streptosporangiaceae bacterium]|nr:hypothetical protein [Streptosporangiaceae bacterium]